VINGLPLIVGHFARARWRWYRLRGERLRRFQEDRARRIVEYTSQHSPFYREHWRGHDLADWRALPTVDKRLMMEHFDSFNTRGLSGAQAMQIALEAERRRDFTPTLHGFTIGLSSGTSGHRGLFVAGPAEQAAWAGTILARMLHKLSQRYRVAFFLRSNSNLYERAGGALIQFRYFDLMLPLDEAVAGLNDYHPQIVIGPPSLLEMLANEHERGSLRITPERLISVAEVLEPQIRERITESFGAPLHQVYQCTEGLLAISCAAGSLHVQEDVVALQYEALDGERVTPIVTDLWRTTQPIIRYRLNDVLRLDPQPCACGSSWQVIQAIEGRSDDVCYFESAAGGRRAFFPDTIRRMILLSSPAIQEYQAIQERPGQLRIFLDLPVGTTFAPVAESVRQSVAATIAQYDCLPADVTIAPGVPVVATGIKRRRVQRIAA
jgi:putative adenylate-forming enzyme